MKKCKPNYKMDKMEGCGEEKHIFKFGACQQCFIKWTQETDKGKEYLQKQTAYRFKKAGQKRAREQKKRDRKMKIDLMSTSKYWSHIFQPKFNELIRIIDHGCGCIASGRTTGQMHGGHYIHAGKNKSLSINSHNVFLQSMHSNTWQSGDILNYQDGLKRTFGNNYYNFIQTLQRCPPLHLTKVELQEAVKIVNELKKKYKLKEYTQLSPQDRIDLRNEINYELNLYPNDFGIYDLNKEYQ